MRPLPFLVLMLLVCVVAGCQDPIPLVTTPKPTMYDVLTGKRWKIYKVLEQRAGGGAVDITSTAGTPFVRFRLDSTVIWTYPDSLVERRWAVLDTATRDIQILSLDRVPEDTVRCMSFISTFVAIRTVTGDTTLPTGWVIQDSFHEPAP